MISENQSLSSPKKEEVSLSEVYSTFKEWSSYLYSRWKMILCIAFIFALIGLAYGYFKKPVYTASTTFVLESGESGAGGLGQYLGLASLAGIDLSGKGGGVFQGDNILELYKSRKMIEKALLSPLEEDTSQLLIDRYIAFNGLRDKWKEKPVLANIRFTADQKLIRDKNLIRLRDSIIGKIVEKINKKYLVVAKPSQRLGIIRVDVNAQDEVFAKEFNNQIVKNVNDFYIQTKTKKAQDNVAILQKKTDSVRLIMDGSIYAAVKVADATPNLNPTRQVQRLAPAQKAQFSAETNKAVLAELLKNLEMAKFSLSKETPLIQVIDDPIYPLKTENNYLLLYPIISFFVALCFISVFLLIKKSILLKLS